MCVRLWPETAMACLQGSKYDVIEKATDDKYGFQVQRKYIL